MRDQQRNDPRSMTPASLLVVSDVHSTQRGTDAEVITRVRDVFAAQSGLQLPAPPKVVALSLGLTLIGRVNARSKVAGNRVTYDLTHADHSKFIATACARRAARYLATRAELSALSVFAIDNLAALLCS